jgi:hypothetical protein
MPGPTRVSLQVTQLAAWGQRPAATGLHKPAWHPTCASPGSGLAGSQAYDPAPVRPARRRRRAGRLPGLGAPHRVGYEAPHLRSRHVEGGALAEELSEALRAQRDVRVHRAPAAAPPSPPRPAQQARAARQDSRAGAHAVTERSASRQRGSAGT